MTIAQPIWQALKPVMYPESDGKPMAETDSHRREMSYAIETLAEYFADAPDVYVAGNLLLYYVEGDPTSRIAPDVFVVKGVPKKERRIYKLWEEKSAPQVVIEVSSKGTRLEDRGTKRELYLMFGVEEYFQWDPLDEYLDPPLQGLRLNSEGRYEEIPRELDGSLESLQLGMRLRREGDRLRFLDVRTGEPILAPVEQARVEAERARVEAERARVEITRRLEAEKRAEMAEAEVVRLQALLKEAGKL